MLYAISDLHLSFAQNKAMDKFGSNWKNHWKKIALSWNGTVTEEDTVLLAGDTSWAMRMDDFIADFEWICDLPGRKVIICGNHDYWWDSTAKLNTLDERVFFMKNSCARYKDVHICGTRGWLCPNDSEFTPHDEKLYRREAARLKVSLDMAADDGAKEIVAMLHFPPKNDKNESSMFSDLLSRYPVKKVIYGHLHGEGSFYRQVKNEPNGIEYRLVSCDFLGFKLVKLMD